MSGSQSSFPVTNEHYNLTVLRIRITAHSLGLVFEDDDRSANHASIFLITSSQHSIRLNMTKRGPTDTMGTYTESSCTYISSNSALRNFDLQPAPGLTVGHAINAIRERGRLNYKLARSGVGCRYWVQTVVNDWAESHMIDTSASALMSPAAVIEALRYNYSQDQNPVFDEVDPGTFV
ncbi:hypothetical protein FQN54_001211 [Arachnomyces sp. PD_36]|nr:hypothetical protein FQN54_001211 [Arachnomyces sp. PD_36]